jgi:RNA polymerase sigma-70 factor (ECF subfamily)
MDFEALAREHRDAVYRQMLRVCGNHEDAEDVLIEALLRAWQNLDRLESAPAFRAWLAQIARRVCFRVRHREALLPLESLAGFDTAATVPDPEKQWQAAELKNLMQSALASLPAAYRDIYELRDLEEMSGEEVAQKLGISLRAMKSRLHRARKLLRERLDAALQVPPQNERKQENGSHSGTSRRGSV